MDEPMPSTAQQETNEPNSAPQGTLAADERGKDAATAAYLDEISANWGMPLKSWLVPQLHWHPDEVGGNSARKFTFEIAKQLSILSKESRDDHLMAMVYIEQTYQWRREKDPDKNVRSWGWIIPRDIKHATGHYTRQKVSEDARKARLEKYQTKRKHEELTEEADDLMDQERSRKRLKAIPKWKRKPRLFVTLKVNSEFLRNVRPRCIAVLKLSPDLLRNFPHDNPVAGPSSQPTSSALPAADASAPAAKHAVPAPSPGPSAPPPAAQQPTSAPSSAASALPPVAEGLPQEELDAAPILAEMKRQSDAAQTLVE